MEPQSRCTPDFQAFCAKILEEGQGYSIRPTPAFEAWESWCAARTLKPGTQKRFGGMMGERFKRDANNGYPRYLGVRAKPAAVGLRIVSSQ